MTNQFPGTFPVIGERDSVLYGYVFQPPDGPDTPAGHVHWTYAVAASGYVSPYLHLSRRAAVLALLTSCQVVAPDVLAVADLDLMGVLHGLSQRYTPRTILRAALDYANARVPDGSLDDDPDVGARRGDPTPVDRALMRRVIRGHIGPFTADDVFALYDKVAPERAPLAAVGD